jgi:hypothetical protein
MYRALIKNYISNLTPIQVKQFASSKDVTLTEQEVNYLTNFVKQNWETFLYDNPEPLFQKASKYVRPEIIQIAKKEFQEAKQKYQSFL